MSQHIFKHVLTQETAYRSLRPKNRREIHRHVVQTSERLAADQLEEVAARRSLEQAKRQMAGMGGRLGGAGWEKPAY